MTDKLPPPLLALFAPRPPLRYIPPQDADPEIKGQKKSQIGGIASYLSALEEYKATDEYTPTESWLQKKERLRYEKQQKLQKLASGDTSDIYDPTSDPQVRGDAFKTLFVSRLDYEVKEQDLEREFGRFGPIERVCLSSLFRCPHVLTRIADTYRKEREREEPQKEAPRVCIHSV